MIQGSAEWHKFREKHIGASEVSAIMGESDFMTIHDLWMLKTGRKEPFKGNWATQRGTDAEPKIKRLYEALALDGDSMLSPVMEYHEWPTLSASLDGINHVQNVVVEFKYPSKEKHSMALNGKVPPTYVDQVQTQMLVSGHETAHYVSFDGAKIAVVVVHQDTERQALILERCKAFWAMVVNDIEPPKKYVVQADNELKLLADTYRAALRAKEGAEFVLNETKEKIVNLIKDDKASFYGFTFNRGTRKGAVEYSKIPSLEGIDLDLYRKADSTVITIKEEK